jgi:hypothetical protein
MSMNGLPNPGSAAKLLVRQRSRAPKVVVARTVPNSAVAQLFFSAVRPLIDLCAGHTKLHVASYALCAMRYASAGSWGAGLEGGGEVGGQ